MYCQDIRAGARFTLPFTGYYIPNPNSCNSEYPRHDIKTTQDCFDYFPFTSAPEGVLDLPEADTIYAVTKEKPDWSLVGRDLNLCRLNNPAAVLKTDKYGVTACAFPNGSQSHYSQTKDGVYCGGEFMTIGSFPYTSFLRGNDGNTWTLSNQPIGEPYYLCGSQLP